MEGVRIANMLYDQRGPLVFSASIHLVLLVAAAIWVLLSPEKDAKDFNFELVPPPSAGSPDAASFDEPLQPIEYKSDDTPLPTLAEIELPERPPIRVEVEMPAPPVEKPPPVVEKQATVEVEPAPAPKQMSWEEFMAQNPDANKTKSVRTQPVKAKPTQIDMSQVRRSLSEISISNLPSATIEAYSMADQAALSGFIASFKAALKRSVDSHPLRGERLRAIVSCDISASGIVSNVRLIRGSGDPEFDRKVLGGYQRLRNFHAPPNGTPLVGLEIEFVQ